MKLRSILFAVTLLLGVTASFGFKSAKKQYPVTGDFILLGQCRGYALDQNDCLTTHTGAVCTITNGAGKFTAYLDDTPPNSCFYVLRQP
jgi:hypothetical protein